MGIFGILNVKLTDDKNLYTTKISFPLGFFDLLCQYIVMVCPYCKKSTNVINSRHNKLANLTWRRRLCSSCEAVITTYESADYSKIINVAKYDNSYQAFNSTKLKFSITNSLSHRTEKFIDTDNLYLVICQQLNSLDPKTQTTSAHLFKLVSKVLKDFDIIAYHKYISNYPRHINLHQLIAKSKI